MIRHKELKVYLEEILQAANYIDSYTKNMTYEQLLDDPKTTQAVILNILIIGENSNKLLTQHPSFTQDNKDMRWEAMRGMRNRIAHSYFEINMEVVWDTIQTSIPEIIERLSSIKNKLIENKPPPEPDLER